MNRSTTDMISGLAVILFVAAIVFTLLSLSHCTPRAEEPKLPSYCYDEAKFRKELLRCVDRADTREASRACRAEAHRSCGLEMTETAR